MTQVLLHIRHHIILYKVKSPRRFDKTTVQGYKQRDKRISICFEMSLTWHNQFVQEKRSRDKKLEFALSIASSCPYILEQPHHGCTVSARLVETLSLSRRDAFHLNPAAATSNGWLHHPVMSQQIATAKLNHLSTCLRQRSGQIVVLTQRSILTNRFN